MFNSNLLNKFKQNKVVINGWLSISNSMTAEAMSKIGWETLTIDMGTCGT